MGSVMNFTNLLFKYLNHEDHRSYKKKFENALMSEASGIHEDLERVTICLEAMEKFQIGISLINNEKKDFQSEKLREEGNENLLSGKLLSALKNYNNSIAMASPNSEKLALAFANRSILLFQMKKYEGCLGDIQRALNNGYPIYHTHKALKRQGACYKALFKYSLASASFSNTLRSLGQAVYLSPEMKEKIRGEVENEISQCNMKVIEGCTMIEESSEKPEACSAPSLSYGQNCEIPAASSGVQLQHTQKFGRHLVATRDLELGDVVMAVEPASFFLYVKDMYTHCRHCCQRSFVLLPCRKCTWALFCSEECQSAASKVHTQECAIMPTFLDLTLGPTAYMTARVLFEHGVDKLALFMESEIDVKYDLRKAGFTNGQFVSSEISAIYHCHQNTRDRSLMENAINVVTAALLVQCLQDQIPQVAKVAGLIYRLCWGFCLNAIDIQELYQDPSMRYEEFCPRGQAVYPVYSLLNHSCDPNIKVAFHGNVLVARVLQPTKQGAQLFVNYKYNYLQHDCNDRYLSLFVKHRFECKCDACIKKWPTLAEMPIYPVIKNKKEFVVYTDKVKEVENLYEQAMKGELSQSQIIPFVEQIHQLENVKGGNLCKTYHKCLKIVELSYARLGNFHHSQFI